MLVTDDSNVTNENHVTCGSDVTYNSIVLRRLVTGSFLADVESVAIGSAECVVLSASLTEIKCEVQAHPVGLADLVVEIKGKGNSYLAEFTYEFAVTEIKPPVGECLRLQLELSVLAAKTKHLFATLGVDQ